jgi:hypothetical protein
MSSSLGARRPGVVTFIGVILYIQAFLAAVGAVVIIAFRNTDSVLEATGVSSSALLTTGIVEAIVAILLFAVAAGIMGGSRGARLFVAIVTAIRMASALWLIVWHHQGGFLTTGLVYLLIGVFVLWALYGNKDSEEYFETH